MNAIDVVVTGTFTTGVPEMDEALISNWNARVGADDSVYIVGDFSYNGGEAPVQYLSRLNGHLHLIRGNHDTGLNHAERLLEIADSAKGAAKDDSKKNEWRSLPIRERLTHALVRGQNEFKIGRAHV